jgi:hypothetical protein
VPRDRQGCMLQGMQTRSPIANLGTDQYLRQLQKAEGRLRGMNTA